MWFALSLAGCAETPSVLVSGWVYQGQEPLAPALPAAELSFLTFDGSSLGATASDEEGYFEMVVPGGQPLFVTVAAEGFVTSVFPGSIGVQPEQPVDDHALYGVSVAVYEALAAQLDGCSALADGGGIVYGEVRVFGITDPYTNESPTASTAQVVVQDADVAEWTGCYLDEEGLAYDPKAVFTGASGKFAVAGVPDGLHDLVVEVLVGPDTWTQNTYPVRIVEGEAVVSPWWPLWASFPIR